MEKVSPQETVMTYRLTIDVNLMNWASSIPAMDTLKRWKHEGKIDLVEAEPPKDSNGNWPTAPAPRLFNSRDPRARWRVKKPPSGGPSFKTMAGVIFPYKDSLKLNMGEVNDVAHLVKHHASKNEFFVTHNLKDFIQEGKRERLKQSFGIIAMTPTEIVEMFTKTEGWK